MNDLFGQAPAPASHTASEALPMAARKASAMKGIYGRISSGSSESTNLTRSLANKYLRQLDGAGGTKPLWTWKAKRTPVRRLFFELTPTEHYTSENDSTLWRTPAARDGKDISTSTAFLSQRTRHAPSLATHLLNLGASWEAISLGYCLAMGFPSKWNDTRPMLTAAQLSRKSQRRSSEPLREMR